MGGISLPCAVKKKNYLPFHSRVQRRQQEFSLRVCKKKKKSAIMSRPMEERQVSSNDQLSAVLTAKLWRLPPGVKDSKAAAARAKAQSMHRHPHSTPSSTGKIADPRQPSAAKAHEPPPPGKSEIASRAFGMDGRQPRTKSSAHYRAHSATFGIEKFRNEAEERTRFNQQLLAKMNAPAAQE